MREKSPMPFVYTCPLPKTILSPGDMIFVYGNYQSIQTAASALSEPFVPSLTGIIAGIPQADEEAGNKNKKRNIAGNSAILMQSVAQSVASAID